MMRRPQVPPPGRQSAVPVADATSALPVADATRVRKAARLDQLLVERGLFESREQARRSVMAGRIEVEGRRVDKPGTAVASTVAVVVHGPREPYVSRAGRKLEFALDHFDVDPAGAVCCDVGASTGGFTDCLLERGARRVYALDVGYGQLDHRLRIDPRVVVMERVNARHLAADGLPERCTLITVDVSFISLLKVVPALLPHLAPGGRLLVLIKPQFEVGRQSVGKGGVVRDEEIRKGIITRRVAELGDLGLRGLGCADSPLTGASGNREALALFEQLEQLEQLEQPKQLEQSEPAATTLRGQR